MLNKKRQITKKREDKVVLQLKTTNVYELTRDDLYKYVTNKENGIIYSDKDITLYNAKSEFDTPDAVKFIFTKYPNLLVYIYNNSTHVYDNEKNTWVKIFGDKSISQKCTLKGLLKRLDRVVAKLSRRDKHFEETQNGIIYGSHRLYKYMGLKLSMMSCKRDISLYKSKLATLDVEIENAREYNKINTHYNLKYGYYDGIIVESFNRPIRKLKHTQKEYLTNIKQNEDQIVSIQDEINKLKVNNYYALSY